jgi:hypothetical protein
MTELKTLKDIFDDEWYDRIDAYSIDANELIDEAKKELKQKAIKRAKHWRKLMHEEANKGKLGLLQYYKGRMEETMEANNITEEDLK